MANLEELQRTSSSGGGVQNMTADHIAPQGGNYEPGRTYDFSFEVNLGNQTSQEIIQLSVISVSSPDISHDTIELKYMNESRKVIGKPTFAELALSCYDYVDKYTAESLFAWYTLGYNIQTGRLGLARNYKKLCTLTQYAPNGQISRQWKLHGCYINKYKCSDLTYDGTEACKVDCTITYDKPEPVFIQSVNTEVAAAGDAFARAIGRAPAGS